MICCAPSRADLFKLGVTQLDLDRVKILREQGVPLYLTDEWDLHMLTLGGVAEWRRRLNKLWHNVREDQLPDWIRQPKPDPLEEIADIVNQQFELKPKKEIVYG